MKNSKKIIFLITIILLLQINFAFAEYIVINEKKSIENISPSTTYEHIEKFTNLGSININVLRTKYLDKNTNIKLLKSNNSISERNHLSKLLNPQIIGAVNGDFFNYNNHSTIGPMVENGILISSPLNDPSFYSFIKTKENTLLFNNWKKTFFRIKNKNFTLPIDYINKPYYNEDKVFLFNHFWSKKTLGNNYEKNILEMIVENNTVKNISLNQSPQSIPENGYVIMGTGKYINIIKKNFKVGDNIEYIEDENFKRIDFSIGGGSKILENSIPLSKFSLQINGRNPRTALGFNKYSKEIILLTVDGRSNSFIGLTQKETGLLMKELGATDAIILDGGGSTEMIKYDFKSNKNKIINFPSDESERRIPNGVGIENTYKNLPISSLLIIPDKKYSFSKTGLNIDVYGVDDNYNKTLLDPNMIDWKVLKGEGNFINGYYFPRISGYHKISANYNGISKTYDLKILDKIVDLKITPQTLEIENGATKQLTILGISEDGYESKINPESISFEVEKSIGNIKNNGLFTASKNSGYGIISASFQGITSYIPVTIGTKKEILYDFEDNFCSFLAYPSEVKGAYSKSNLSPNSSTSGKLDFDFRHTDKTRAAYIKFGENGLILPENSNKIGIWVYGNHGNNHWLRARLVDEEKTTFTIDLGKSVDWIGWKYVEANLPKTFTGNLFLDRIYLVEINPIAKDLGTILLEDLTITYKDKYTGVLPKNINKVKKIEDFKLYPQSNEIISIRGRDLIENKIPKLTENLNLSFLNNANKSIRSNDYKQFINLTSKFWENPNRDTLIILNNPLEFTDKREGELFYEKLESFSKSNSNIYVLFPNEKNEYFIKRNVNFISLNSKEDSTKYLQFNENNGHLSFELKEIESPLK